MHRLGKTNCLTVRAKIKKWFSSEIFVAEKLRDALVGAVLTIAVAEVCAYKLLKQSVRAGNFSPYVIDMFIMILAILETVISPLLGWWGSTRRREMLLVSCALTSASAFTWFALPNLNVPETIVYCAGKNTVVASDNTRGVSVQMFISLFTFISFGVSRIVIWCHGIAYIDEHSPSRMSMHYGILSTIRLLGLALGYNILTEFLETNTTLQILMIALGIWGNALQIYVTIPKIIKAPEEPVAEGLSEASPFVPKVFNTIVNGFFSSVKRVFFNTLATSHMVAMGLIAAALWGFAYHQTDFLKAKYYVEEKRNSFMNNAEVLRNHAVILAVAYMGLKFTSPIMSSLVKTTVLLHAVKMCAFSIILYVVMAVISCDTGEVVGLQGTKYVQPECSQHCGCTSLWQEFTPVCIVDKMTTYLSPCHAGCTGVEEVGGVQVFANCSCGALVSHAARGSCSSNSCSGALQFHQILYTLLLSASALAVQAHGSMLMRSVETQDQSVMLAMTGAMVAIFTFVFGHMVFVAIDGMNCVWVESGKCLLHSPRHFYLVSGVSGGMVMIACIITITMLVSLKLSKRRKKKAQESLDESYI